MIGAKLKIAVLYDLWEEQTGVVEEPEETPAPGKRKRGRKKRKEKEDREEIFEALEKLGHQPFYQVLDGTTQSLASLPKCGADLVFNLTESFSGDVEKFKRDLNTLMDIITNISRGEVRFVLMTPLFHENLGEPLPNPSAHNLQLESFANAIKERLSTL